MYEIIRNGHTNTEMGILVRERPSIPSAEYNYTELNIPGRDGSIFKEDGTVSDITITLPILEDGVKVTMRSEKVRDVEPPAPAAAIIVKLSFSFLSFCTHQFCSSSFRAV